MADDAAAFTDARYLVPPLDMSDADHRDTSFLIADDRRTLASRVRQLLSGTTWAENPRSRTRGLITNVRRSQPTTV
jgi:p-cumate 2,3-dioxygenase beta subunit